MVIQFLLEAAVLTGLGRLAGILFGWIISLISRAVFESLGVGDVVAKSLGTSNAYNMVRATFDALKSQQSPRMVAQRRGRSVTEIISRREGQKGEQASAT